MHAHRTARILATACSAVGLLVAGLLNVAQAAPGSGQLAITAITPGFAVPDTIGDYPFVTTGDPFSVSVSSSEVLSTTKATALVLVMDTGPEAGRVLARTSMAANATTAVFTGAVATKEVLAAQLKVAIDKNNPGVLPGFATVDVLDQAVAAGPSASLLSILGGGGLGKNCDPTRQDPVCIEMLGGAVSNQLLAEGNCDPSLGCISSPTFTWLANVSQVAKLILKCDKTLCANAGVPKYAVTVQLTRDGASFDLVGCPSNDTVGADRRPCIASSNRSNTSDLIIVINWIDDGRVVIKT